MPYKFQWHNLNLNYFFNEQVHKYINNDAIKQYLQYTSMQEDQERLNLQTHQPYRM